MKSLLFTLFLLLSICGFSQQEDKSPYLEVLSENANVPLKESAFNVEISGTIAHVQLTQVYQNNGKHVIEANYIISAFHASRNS